MKLRRATIKDIARESGYSVMTVSFALRNHEKVKPSTREKIQKVAEKLGYRPDPEIARLMNRVRRNPELETTEPFAVLNLCENKEDFKRDLFARRVMEGASERLKKHGFDLVEYWTGDGGFDSGEISKNLRERDINVLLIPPVPPKAPITELDWSQYTIVSVEERPILPNFHRIHPHHYNNMLFLLDKLVELGFGRIGFLSTPHMLGLDKYAYFGAFHSWFTYLHPELPLLEPLTDGTEQKALKAWYRQHKPDVVIVTAGWMEGAIRATSMFLSRMICPWSVSPLISIRSPESTRRPILSDPRPPICSWRMPTATKRASPRLPRRCSLTASGRTARACDRGKPALNHTVHAYRRLTPGWLPE